MGPVPPGGPQPTPTHSELVKIQAIFFPAAFLAGPPFPSAVKGEVRVFSPQRLWVPFGIRVTLLPFDLNILIG